MENEYNKKIKILHVAQAAGGVDRYLRTLLKYLDKDKFENIVVLSQDFKKEDYKDIADTFISIKMERAIGKHDIEAIKQLRKLIKKYAPDIVYAHSSKAGAIARVANIGMKNYCIYNPHGWAFNMQVSKKKQSLYTFIEKVEAPFCNKIVCISNAEKKSALDKNICRENKLQVIFNGIDIYKIDFKDEYILNGFKHIKEMYEGYNKQLDELKKEYEFRTNINNIKSSYFLSLISIGIALLALGLSIFFEYRNKNDNSIKNIETKVEINNNEIKEINNSLNQIKDLIKNDTEK